LCPAIKHAVPKPACADFKGMSCDACLIDIDDEEHITFERMAPIENPECTEASAVSAFDLATSYPELAKKLYPEGGCHPLICDIPEEILTAAWALFESLEEGIAAATSLAAKSVNRNTVGYKRYNFRPLRWQIY
jgi:hypothetical protein